ncbi:hypothetical protein PR048_019612 [Dryococelus australis]|uniref:Uncharacterized protein n=1 Tax=Dryococelus australis TaxID=614101 RepID=A0ABQ9H488_9NEOP|nr:hypothetical protein PR048_019612 [Dryococelus australis]
MSVTHATNAIVPPVSLTLRCTIAHSPQTSLSLDSFVVVQRSAGSSLHSYSLVRPIHEVLCTTSLAERSQGNNQNILSKITPEIQSSDGQERTSADKLIWHVWGGSPLQISMHFSRYQSALGTVFRPLQQDGAGEAMQSSNTALFQSLEHVNSCREAISKHSPAYLRLWCTQSRASGTRVVGALVPRRKLAARRRRRPDPQLFTLVSSAGRGKKISAGYDLATESYSEGTTLVFTAISNICVWPDVFHCNSVCRPLVLKTRLDMPKRQAINAHFCEIAEINFTSSFLDSWKIIVFTLLAVVRSVYQLGLHAELKTPVYLKLFSAFEAERRRSVKGDTATRIKSPIVSKRKALNWRAVFSSCCVYLWDFQRLVIISFGYIEEGKKRRDVLTRMNFKILAWLRLDAHVQGPSVDGSRTVPASTDGPRPWRTGNLESLADTAVMWRFSPGTSVLLSRRHSTTAPASISSLISTIIQTQHGGVVVTRCNSIREFSEIAPSECQDGFLLQVTNVSFLDTNYLAIDSVSKVNSWRAEHFFLGKDSSPNKRQSLIHHWDGLERPRSRSEGAIRATVTRTLSASLLQRARRAVFPS